MVRVVLHTRSGELTHLRAVHLVLGHVAVHVHRLAVHQDVGLSGHNSKKNHISTDWGGEHPVECCAVHSPQEGLTSLPALGTLGPAAGVGRLNGFQLAIEGFRRC